MRPRTRPRPVLGARRQPGPYRIQRHVAGGGEKMGLIHGNRAEPALPEMAVPAVPGIDVRGIPAMQVRNGVPEAVGIGRG